MSLSLCSLNVRGIRDSLEQKAIFLFCKKIKADFVFWQETHAILSDLNYWKAQWKNDIWLSCKSSRSAEVAILKSNCNAHVIKHIAHKYGGWILLVIEFYNNIFILGNIYGHNNEQKKKYNRPP